jgi:hypothetical protein
MICSGSSEDAANRWRTAEIEEYSRSAVDLFASFFIHVTNMYHKLYHTV